MVRGLAAVEVCLGHMRGFFFVDYGQTSGGLATRIFYLATSLHHQAVMVFFVLSGFLVGGSVVKGHRTGRWRWSAYLLRRLCRLWIVVLPALVLTVFWDRLGAYFSPQGYAGAWYPQLMSGPAPGYDLSLTTFLGNLGFLQTIAVPPLGSNGPLWSLANEFWYYLLFPLALQLVVASSGWLARIVAAILLVALGWLLPVGVLLLGLIWLYGVLVSMALATPRIRPIVTSWPIAALGALGLIATLLGSRFGFRWANDYAVGAAFAILLPWMATATVASTLYRRIGFALSELSYTLYLVHFPLLAWIYFLFVAPAQFSPGARAGAIYVAVLAVVMAYAWGIWWLFERRTDRVREAVARWLRARGWWPRHA